MSGYFHAILCCFSCFQCSAMWKINSSGYSTQANLNTVPSSLFLYCTRHQGDVCAHYLHPTSIYTSTSAQSITCTVHHFICMHALAVPQSLTPCTSSNILNIYTQSFLKSADLDYQLKTMSVKAFFICCIIIQRATQDNSRESYNV